MIELNERTLAQIVSDDYRAASIFEKYDLDYCCKGKRSLQKACEEKHLPIDQLVSELATVKDSNNAPVDFQKMSLTQLAGYIVFTHHDYVKREMPQIFSYLQRVASRHGQRHPEMLKVFHIFSSIKEEMEFHMQKEEKILFPRIKMLEEQVTEQYRYLAYDNFLSAPIAMMEEEHDHAGAMMAEIRQLTHNYDPPADACTTYRLSYAALRAFEFDLHHHVHLENNILFPKALELFRSIRVSMSS